MRELVPHQGAMCLLEEVLEWDAETIACRATSHRDPANPLRDGDGLAAIAGVEFAAQAAAAHGALTGNFSGRGYLATLRNVVCRVERLDTEPENLTVRATQVAAQGARVLYDFRIDAGGRELLTGRLSVVLRK
jgi:predicted hotdog family 3-hydroxylacyl-ACP dehydratase